MEMGAGDSVADWRFSTALSARTAVTTLGTKCIWHSFFTRVRVPELVCAFLSLYAIRIRAA